MAAKNLTLNLGLIPISVSMEVAVDAEASSAHTVCVNGHDPARPKQGYTCPECNKSGALYEFPDRAVDTGGELKIITRDDAKTAGGAPHTGRKPTPATPDAAPVTLAFHPRIDVFEHTVAGASSAQNVYPQKGSEKQYTLLRDALLARPDVVCTMIWAPSSKNGLWVLEVVDGRVTCSSRSWPESVREAKPIAPTEVSELEVAQFAMFVDASMTPFDVNAYVNESRKGIEQLVADSERSYTSDAAQGANAASDLLGQIQASLAEFQLTAGESPNRRKGVAA